MVSPRAQLSAAAPALAAGRQDAISWTATSSLPRHRHDRHPASPAAQRPADGPRIVRWDGALGFQPILP